MSLGFIIIRHVNSKISDYYWKECYTCIRKFYDNPIVIIDDSSNKEFFVTSMLENVFSLFFACTIASSEESIAFPFHPFCAKCLLKSPVPHPTSKNGYVRL